MVKGPAIRAAAVHDSLDFLDVFERGARTFVMSQVPLPARTTIEKTARSSWISIEDDHHTVDAIVARFGAQRATRYWRDNLLHLAARPLLHTFLSGMLAVVGRDPQRVIALIPTGWSLAYRDMGVPRFAAKGSRGTPALVFENVPQAVRAYPNYFLCWRGVCAAFAGLSGVRGEVDLDVSGDGSYAEASFRWIGAAVVAP